MRWLCRIGLHAFEWSAMLGGGCACARCGKVKVPPSENRWLS